MSTTESILDTSPSAGARRARLYVVLEASRPLAGSARWSLEDLDEVRIGRGDTRSGRRHEREGALTLELELPDRRMSAAHARLARVGGRWVLQDVGSKNGTRVNGTRVARAVLASGDLLELGGTTWQYVEDLESERDPGDLDGSSLLDEAPGLATVIPAVARSVSRLGAVAKSPVSVVLTGESGTGKELAARALHRLSGRKGRFVAVNCGALSEKLVEGELFGSRRGAFTGATEDRVGLVRAAHGGTLLLDEIGDLPPPAQAALLRVIQEREVVPVGDTSAIPVDLRVVAATHRDLSRMAATGAFRSDLLARLRGFELELPPLRARLPDLGLLVATLLRKLGAEADGVAFEIEAARKLVAYRWPLNVRELEQALAAALGLASGRSIALDHLPRELREAPADAEPAHELGQEERALRDRLASLLGEQGGNVSAVARAMGKDRKQIRRWIARFGLRLEPAARDRDRGG